MNKHKMIAFFMAPFLAVGGFIAAGYYSGDKEPLMRVLLSEQGCKLSQARCVLQSAGIELKLSADQQLAAATSFNIELQSSVALDDVVISVAEKNQQSQPQRMKKQDATHWHVQAILPEKIEADKLRLRLVVGWQNEKYFADEIIQH